MDAGRVASLLAIAASAGILASCAGSTRQVSRAPHFVGAAPPRISIAVADVRREILSKEKRPSFEGLIRDGFMLPFTEGRPYRPADESFADRIAIMLQQTFWEAGSLVSVVDVPDGSSTVEALELLGADIDGVGILLIIGGSKFDALVDVTFVYDYMLRVVGSSGDVMAKDTLRGEEKIDRSFFVGGENDLWVNADRFYQRALAELLNGEPVVQAISAASVKDR